MNYLLGCGRSLPVAAYLQCEYGYRDIYMGVPAVIGGAGVEKILELSLSDEEKEMLAKSAKSVQSITDVVKSAN